MKWVKGLALSAAAGSLVWAGGYKIPEQSINSTALGAAYVAHTMGADTAYYNPANMAFMEDKRYVEGGVTLAHLPSNEYTLIDPYSGESKVEDLPIPYLHYVSRPMGDFRWGVSLTVPGGLTKRWEAQPQKSFAEEFTLKVIELNPSLAYKIAENFSIGGGVRMIYSEGVVKSTGQVSRDMEGDTVEFGYNLAVTYQPTSDITLAATYRSNIDLEEEGNAKLYSGETLAYNGDASVTVPLPAALNLAIAKSWQERFTLEFVYERTFWSEYEALDFEYGGADIGGLAPYFDTPIPKRWKDTDTFRIGATVKMDNKITAMFGFAIDETPAPLETLGFELPDSDARIFSMGFRYQQNEQLSWGAAFLYDSKEPISMPAGINENPVLANGGSFHEGGAFLTTVGIAYEY
ncbi:MAG: outer membrane protein transport protein [Campylobacterales bacterium]|nr:outer membrane protein transport protein [Campylobacterales bacterium]HEO97720.1 long-chain fatty acid transporter [Campylobacterota bacterium]